MTEKECAKRNETDEKYEKRRKWLCHFLQKNEKGAGLNRPPSPSPPEGRPKESRTA